MSLLGGRAAALTALGGCMLGMGMQTSHGQVPPGAPGGLPPVSVSASRDAVARSAGVSSAPANNVTVISEEAIRRSTATSLAEVLATEANLNLHSFYGNDRYANVDMRGMGDTAVSNVLIVVDGEVINENDLSAPDLSIVPLSQIERIEVIRGGGSVLYGPGAVGGVVSITTRRLEPGQTHAEAGLRLGSFGSRSVKASVEGGVGRFAGRLQASHATTDGYRTNSELRTEQVGGELRWLLQLSMGLSEVYLRASQSKGRYGMPGDLPGSVLGGREAERRATNNPDDGGAVDDKRAAFGMVFDWHKGGRLELKYAQRDRHNPYLIGYAPTLGIPIEEDKRLKGSQIRSRREELSLRYQLAGSWRGLPQVLTVGHEWGKGRYVSERDGLDNPELRMTGRMDSLASLVDVKLSPMAGLLLHAGVRMDQKDVQEDRFNRDEDCDFVFIGGKFTKVNCVSSYVLQSQLQRRWTHQSAELGASWRLSPAWEPYASISRHQRQPNLDELAEAQESLRPQRGQTREVGMRYTPSSNFSAALTAFVMHITDEIYYGPVEVAGPSLNRNFAWRTRREGLELDARWRVWPTLTLRGQWAHVKPRFEGLDTRLPLVPGDTVSASVQWRPVRGLQWSTSARHVSKRVDGSDWLNTRPHLDPYTVVDTGLRYEQGPIELGTGITNLFDEVYTTKAYAGRVYPMPGRGGYVSLNLRY